jgi:uncharacterized protein (DUF58 family)
VIVTGRTALLALLCVLPVAASPWPATLFWAALFVVLFLVGVDIALAANPRACEFGRTGDTAARLGQSAETVLTVTNMGRRRFKGQIRDAWPPSARAEPRANDVDIPGGQQESLLTRLRPTRRGDQHAAVVTARSIGPLRLAGRQSSHRVPWQVRILPPFLSRKHLPSRLAKLRQIDGLLPVLIRGQGTEFDSLREYVIGDDVRSIDWRATARRADVVVRTWRPERDRRVVLVLDTGRTSAARIGAAPRLDAALDAALLLGTLASRAGDKVDLIAVDDRPRMLTRGSGAGGSDGSGGHGDALAGLLESMAGLHARLVETDGRRLVAEVLRRVRQRALIVLFTTLDEAAITEGLLPVLPSLTRKHVVMLASVTDPQVLAMLDRPDDARSTYDAAAAERTLAAHRRVTALLRRLDVEVVDAGPAEFASKVSDAYLSMKAAGRL